MGALAHYLEAAGIPTTQISLIREHTETIQPPRALWVPFELGRPLGLPGDPAFQRRVLLAALDLLTREQGPVLEDFPEEIAAPTKTDQAALSDLACPVNFAPAAADATDETGQVVAACQREITELRSWYDLSRKQRGYTALLYFTPEEAGQLLSDFVLGKPLTLPAGITSTASALRFAAQDLKSCYFEAALARPDFPAADTTAFTAWFWQQTAASQLLRLVKETCLAADDEQLRLTGAMSLIPLDQG